MDMYAIIFAVFSVLVASGAWFFSHQALRFLATILVATTGPLILGPAMVLMAGLTQLVSSGIVVRSGSALERLGRARTFGFIKTGILTDVLNIPYGFEIYSLLTRFNPLHKKRPYALPYNGRRRVS